MQEIEFEEDKTIETSQLAEYITHFEIMREVAPLGLTAYGGPMAHIALIKSRFIDQNKWLSEAEFTELFSICQSLPGPTSTQLVIAIGTMANRSWTGGVLAFILFSGPSAIVMLIAGLLMKASNSVVFNQDVQSLLTGFQISAIAIVAQAAYKLFQSVTQERFSKGLWALSAIFYLLFPQTDVMLALLLAGACANLLFQRYKSRQSLQPVPDTDKSESVNSFTDNKFMGIRSLALYVLIFLCLKVIRKLSPSLTIVVADGFYTIGSLIIGGGHVVLPMLLTQFADLITPKQFWDGFTLVSMMPGPMFNIAIYQGAVMGGLYMGFVAWVALFIPAFLVIWGLMPYWQTYRKKLIFQQILQGISAVAVGFVASSVIQMFLTSSKQASVFVISPIVIVAYFLLEYRKIQAPFVIIMGGIVVVIYDNVSNFK